MNQADRDAGIRLCVNGEDKRIPSNWTVQDLIAHLELNAGQVAVEVNRRIVGRAGWPELELAEGDQVEIVHFVGGGGENESK